MMRIARFLLLSLALGALTLTACTDDNGDTPGATATPPGTAMPGGASTPAGTGDGAATPEPGTSGGSGATGPGLTISEAQASDLPGPLLVRGYLVATADGVRLCEALAESYPPQCGGARLTVTGLDLDTVEGLQEASGVRWTDGEVKLLGDVEGDALTVGNTSSA